MWVAVAKTNQTRKYQSIQAEVTLVNLLVSRKKDKMTNNEPQNITQETKDRVTRTPLKTGGELRCTKKQYSYFN
jgi:hypothetical protein